ncbi:MAG: rod shape-determining protein MreD [Anaerolineae bacterium]|nr:rod shape-determining protein MreD [Anaerolineae bacterium]
MGSFLSIPILALAAALQASVVLQFSIFGGRPDLIFLLTIAWALNSTLDEGVIWAFAGGILKDLLSASPTGTSVVGLVILVFGIYFVRRQIYRVSIISLVWITLLGGFFQQITVLIIMFLTGFQPAFLSTQGMEPISMSFTYVIFPTMVYNLVLMFPIYWIVRRIQKRVQREKLYFS